MQEKMANYNLKSWWQRSLLAVAIGVSAATMSPLMVTPAQAVVASTDFSDLVQQVTPGGSGQRND